MEIRLVIFLACTSVVTITNALMIWFVYRALAGLASHVADIVVQFERENTTRAIIGSMQVAAARALDVTELAKQKFAECDPVMVRAQEQYRSKLVAADSRLEELGNELSASARKLRDAIAKPAFAVMSLSARMERIRGSRKVED